ncbi:MAG: LacI family DNA-binding transcriptional regulator [Polaromonas sp.]
MDGMSDPHSKQQPALPALPRRRPQSVTVSDVARLAGVSAMTVSRAVNTPDQVPVATLMKVREAVAKIGYVPNLLAGGLRSNKSRLVAALVPTLAGPVFMETIQGLTAALAEQGYQLMLGQSGYENSREDDLLGAIIGRRPDGIVLTGIMHSPEGRRRLLAAGIPVVETWDLTPTPIDMLVGFSHAEVGRSVCDYLHAHGRRRLAVIGGDDERSHRRNLAFVEAAARLGISVPPIHLVPAPTSLGSGRSGLRALLAEHPGIDAIFCSSDLLALGVLIEAQAQGIEVPGRLAVMGFGDLSLARDLNPALTTVRIDGTRIGRQAAQYIVDCAEGRQLASRVMDIGFSIIERASV